MAAVNRETREDRAGGVSQKWWSAVPTIVEKIVKYVGERLCPSLLDSSTALT